MSTVYAATDALLSRAVAVKLMSDVMLAEPEGLARFRHEARASAQLRTPRVPQIYDIGVLPEGNPYLVMERLDGKDLAQTLMDLKALPVELAIDMILQTCDALAEVHARGMVHRDLKPANLFVTTALDGSPFVKVLDFGISKLLTSKKEGLALTRPGHAVGTPEYMAPERLEVGSTIDPRADIWSLGVILYEILTGIGLFAAASLGEIVANIRGLPIPNLSAHRTDSQKELDLVLLKCLARNRDARYADVGKLAAALAPFGPPGSVAFAEHIVRTMERARGVPFLENTGDIDESVPSLRDLAAAAAVAEQRLLPDETLAEIDAGPRSHKPALPRAAWSVQRTAAVVLVLFAMGMFLFALSRGRTPDPAAAVLSGTTASGAAASAPTTLAVTRKNDDDPDGLDHGEVVSASPEASAPSVPSAPPSGSTPPAPIAVGLRPRSRPQPGVRLALERPLAAGTTLFCDGAELSIAPKRPARVAAGTHLVKALSAGRTVWASKINVQDGQLVILRIPESYAAPQE